MKLTKIETIAIQLITDHEDLIRDVDGGLYGQEEIVKQLKRINEKMKEWKKEADRIIDEANAVDNKAEEGE